MVTPPRQWVGYALLTAGCSLLFDTYTFLQTDWSPLHVPMSAPDELSFGYLLAICGVAVLLWPRLILLGEDIAPERLDEVWRKLCESTRRVAPATAFTVEEEIRDAS